MTIKERLVGCILGGAIGDAWGSAYENLPSQNRTTTFYLGKTKEIEPTWSFTDDTQLTILTLEALLKTDKLTPEELAACFLHYYNKGKITGIGASTLKALQELQAGGHWSQVGRTGEYAAGNGAAMRIAPFAFWDNCSREDIRNFCRITHRNDEAYAGALAVVIAMSQIIEGKWKGDGSLIELILPHLPDTKVRDRLMELHALIDGSITDAAKLGVNGYVVNSVPFAVYCASQVKAIGIENMFRQIIDAGGDTDTNASIAGQIAGALFGEEGIPHILKEKIKGLVGFDWLMEAMGKAKIDVVICDECRSKFYASASKMASLCPECAHILYGYENCAHRFENGRCINCFWDGSQSGYTKKLTGC